jgi:hypothetical protein
VCEAVQHFLGRTKPVLLMGTNTEKVLSLSGSLNFDATCRRADDCYYDSPPVDWEAASDNAELVCYRDFTGRRIFGMLGGVDVKDVLWPGQASLSFSVTEAEYNEFYGLPLEAVEPVNLLSDENSSFEGGTTGDWGTGYLGAPATVSITSDLTRSTEGLRALKVVFPTAAAGCGPQLSVTGLDTSKSYVATARAYVPAASPHVRFGNPFGGTSNADTTIKDQWQTLSISWSGQASVYLVPKSIGATTAGQAAWFDDFRVYEV